VPSPPHDPADDAPGFVTSARPYHRTEAEDRTTNFLKAHACRRRHAPGKCILCDQIAKAETREKREAALLPSAPERPVSSLVRPALAPDTLTAALARVRGREAAPSPHDAVSSEPTPATPDGPPRNPKSSVAADAAEPPCDVRESPAQGRAARDLGLRHEQRNNRLQKRMRLLDEIRSVSDLHSLKNCGAKALAGAVSVTQKGDGGGGFAGVFRCASVWSCPECSPIVRADRASSLEGWASEWMQAGHGLAMATLTTRHHKHARLGPQIERTAGAWRRMLQSRWWRRFRERHGIVACVRALEMTHSWSNSWHTHIHVGVFTETKVSAETAQQMQDELYDHWRGQVKHAGLGMPTRKHGVLVEPCRTVSGASDLAKYLVKVQDKDNEKAPERALGNELVRGDLKDGRHDGRTPFEILRRALAETAVERAAYDKAARRARRRPDDAAAQDAADAARALVHANPEMGLWLEYEAATKGHRMLTWTGDKERLEEVVGDLTENPAHVLVDEAGQTKAVLVQVEPSPWKAAIAYVPGRRGQLKQAVTATSATATAAGLDPETEARAAVVAILESWGLKAGSDFTAGREDDPERELDPSGRIDLGTGEVLAAELPVPPVRPEHRPRPRWKTPVDLHCDKQLLGITPRDNVRPERARRRAAGLPVSA
jgi:hypothetical protein